MTTSGTSERVLPHLLRQHLDSTAGVLPPQRAGKDTGARPHTDRPHRAVASPAPLTSRRSSVGGTAPEL